MKKLLNKIAKLETQLDFFETEFKNLNLLLKKCGFENGISTLKESATALLEEDILMKKLK